MTQLKRIEEVLDYLKTRRTMTGHNLIEAMVKYSTKDDPANAKCLTFAAGIEYANFYRAMKVLARDLKKANAPFKIKEVKRDGANAYYLTAA